jgi:type I restriction enzyme M protein
MLNPREDETMIDTASGSCGFPVHTIFHVRERIIADKGLDKNRLFTFEKKSARRVDYVNEKAFAVDFDEKAARTLNLIAGDGQTNVLHLNTLDYERWDERTKDGSWTDIYSEGWKKLKKTRAAKDNRAFTFDILMANPPFAGDIKESRILAKYDLGRKAKGACQNEIGRDILFIERNLDFLRPGGRMAIAPPQGRFNNSSDAYIRAFLAELRRILAVAGLRGDTFKPRASTKTSALFVQKWDEKRRPKVEGYPIFFAAMQESGKDNSGDKIHEPLQGKHGHLIVRRDLFNRGGETRDGIAEAFVEFAKKDGLSFLGGPFDDAKRKALLEYLEASEIRLSELLSENERFGIDAEFVKKEYLQIINLL